MSETYNTTKGWRKFLPLTVQGAAGLVVVAALAFFLGGALSGGGVGSGNGAVNGADNNDAGQVAEDASVAAWTCSMHPQIQLPKEGKCPICFMDLIPVEMGDDGGLDPGQLRMSETARELARIETSVVRRASATTTSDA